MELKELENSLNTDWKIFAWKAIGRNWYIFLYLVKEKTQTDCCEQHIVEKKRNIDDKEEHLSILLIFSY